MLESFNRNYFATIISEMGISEIAENTAANKQANKQTILLLNISTDMEFHS